MAHQQRQYDGIYRSVEIGCAVVAPGALATATPVYIVVAVLVPGGGAANCEIGDIITAVPPAAAAPLGISWTASVISAGSVGMTFVNATGGSVTPVSATWTFIAEKILPIGN